MRGIVFAGPGLVALEQLPDPVIEDPRDVIVEVEVSAICGTDLHALHGIDGIPPGTPLGHEYVGRLVEVGSAVRGLRVGDRVVGNDFVACGRCWYCQRGDHWECPERSFFGFGTTFGKRLGGAQAELLRVPFADTVLCLLPAGCDPHAAVFVGDSLATGFIAVERGGVAPGDVVAVVGGGAIGQLVSLSSQAVGAAAVVVVDLLDARCRLADATGALGVPPEGARSLVDELTDGRGADVVIEAAGGPKPLDAAFQLVRPRGTVVSVSVHLDRTYPLPVARSFAEELTLGFAIGDGMRVRPRLLPLVTTGAIDPLVIVTEHVALEGVVDAYARFARHESVKVLVDVAR